MKVTLVVIEDIISASGAAEAIEALLPSAVRRRQLRPGTLLAGMMLAVGDGRPAHLTRAHQALTTLPEPGQKRLGVTEAWADGPHQLTYRQAGHTFRLINRALSKASPDGAPAPRLQHMCDQLTEASIPGRVGAAVFAGHDRPLAAGLAGRRAGGADASGAG